MLPLDMIENIRTFNIIRIYRLRVEVGVEYSGEKARAGFTVEGFLLLEGAKVDESKSTFRS